MCVNKSANTTGITAAFVLVPNNRSLCCREIGHIKEEGTYLSRVVILHFFYSSRCFWSASSPPTSAFDVFQPWASPPLAHKQHVQCISGQWCPSAAHSQIVKYARWHFWACFILSLCQAVRTTSSDHVTISMQSGMMLQRIQQLEKWSRHWTPLQWPWIYSWSALHVGRRWSWTKDDLWWGEGNVHAPARSGAGRCRAGPRWRTLCCGPAVRDLRTETCLSPAWSCIWHRLRLRHNNSGRKGQTDVAWQTRTFGDTVMGLHLSLH